MNKPFQRYDRYGVALRDTAQDAVTEPAPLKWTPERAAVLRTAILDLAYGSHTNTAQEIQTLFEEWL